MEEKSAVLDKDYVCSSEAPKNTPKSMNGKQKKDNKTLDHYTFLGNCPAIPPLRQQ